MKRRTLWLWFLAGLAVVLAAGLTWWGTGTRRTAKRFITAQRVQAVTHDDGRTTVSFAEPVRGTAGLAFNLDVAWSKTGAAELTLLDQENDDGWVPTITWTPAKHRLVVAVASGDGEPDGAMSSVVVNYRVSGRRLVKTSSTQTAAGIALPRKPWRRIRVVLPAW